MRTEIDFIALLVCMLFWGVSAGTHSAMQLLTYARTEKNGDDEAEGEGFVDRLVEDPVRNYFSIGLAKAVAFGVVCFVGYRFAMLQMQLTGAIAITGFVIGVILLPALLAGISALRSPERFVQASRLFVYPVLYLFRPAAYLFIKVLDGLSPRLVDALSFPALTFQKRIELVGYKEGDEETDEQHLMSSVFEFGDTRVREVMVPRIDMVAVNIHMQLDEAASVIVDAGHSRIPVFDESIDKVLGVIFTKDVLKKMIKEEEFTLASVRRDVYFVPESKMIDELLAEFQERKIHLAIVVDEYGGTAGLITLEDVLEELVGDIQDESDAEEELIKRVDGDTVICNARIRLDEFNEQFGIELPEAEADTLGGFLYEMIGRVPRVGETIDRNGIRFTIQSVVRQRIGKVVIKGLSSVAGGAEDVV